MKLEQVRVVLEINEVTQYDNLGMNILMPTFTWQFLDYKNYDSTRRRKAPPGGDLYFDAKNNITVSNPGVKMIDIRFELANSKMMHFRKTLAIWDWIAYVGGFGFSIVLLGTWVYRTAK